MQPQKQVGSCLGALAQAGGAVIMIGISLIGLAVNLLGWVLWVVGTLGAGIWVVLLLLLAGTMLD